MSLIERFKNDHSLKHVDGAIEVIEHALHAFSTKNFDNNFIDYFPLAKRILSDKTVIFEKPESNNKNFNLMRDVIKSSELQDIKRTVQREFSKIRKPGMIFNATIEDNNGKVIEDFGYYQLCYLGDDLIGLMSLQNGKLFSKPIKLKNHTIDPNGDLILDRENLRELANGVRFNFVANSLEDYILARFIDEIGE